MARTVLKEAKTTPTLWQRLVGGAVSARLTRDDNPPLTANQLGYYLGALVGRRPEPAQARIARTLVWFDIRTRQYHPRCLEWYPLAASQFPDDERCAFFAAALAFHGVLELDDLERESVYTRILRSDWRMSTLWARLELPRTDLLRYMTRVVADTPSLKDVTADRLPVLEAALESGAVPPDQQVAIARCLAASYRAARRQDEPAEIVFRFLFLQAPDDVDNSRYLAELFLARNKRDANAVAVYSRMLTVAESSEDEHGTEFWSAHLARTLLLLNKIDGDTLPILMRALKQAPEDRLLEAAVAYAASQSAVIPSDPEVLKHLEAAVAYESEFLPHFQSRHWNWSLVPRALAHAWGLQGRQDALAAYIYSRATELCPDERPLWNYYAIALMEAKDYSARALDVYEKVKLHGMADGPVLQALGLAYYEKRLHESPADARRAIQLYEQLFRLSLAPLEIRETLAQHYLRQDRLSDVGIAVISQLIVDEGESGALALRLAQEFRARSEAPAAIQWYSEAVRLLPKNFVALYEFGEVLRMAKDLNGALAMLVRATALPQAEKHFGVHFALGEVLVELGKREEAKRIFQIIIDEIDPGHTPTLLHLARLNLRYEQEGARQAESLYGRAAQVDPNNAETFRKMADLYREKGEYDRELQALEKYLQLGEPDAERLKELADLYVKRKDFSKAESALRRIVSLGRANKDTYKLLGDVIAKGRDRAA